MKYFSTLIFVAALIFSWILIHRESAISFEIHASIQQKLVEIIEESVAKAKPMASHIEVLEISTEPTSENTINARYKFKYEDVDSETKEKAEHIIEGEARLLKEANMNIDDAQWRLENLTTNSSSIIFKDGILITPGGAIDETSVNSTNNPNSTSESPSPSLNAETKSELPVTPEATQTPAALPNHE